MHKKRTAFSASLVGIAKHLYIHARKGNPLVDCSMPRVYTTMRLAISTSVEAQISMSVIIYFNKSSAKIAIKDI